MPSTCPTALLLLALAAPATAQPAPSVPEPLWETTGLSTPESVVLDPARNQFYVSNMASWGEGATPGDGFISRLDAQGRILELKWVTGLQNPKGLALANGRLYAGDDDALVEIDLDSGAIVRRHMPEDGGPGAFNDATADPQGNVYVFSRRLDTVYRLDGGLGGGRFAPWARIDTRITGKPNGLRAEADRLVMGSWQVPGPEGEQLGHLSTVAFADRAIGRIGTRPIGHIDGIEPDGRGGYTVTDWTHGKLLHVGADGQVRELLSLAKGSADHHYAKDERLLVIPLLFDGTVRAYRWAPAD